MSIEIVLLVTTLKMFKESRETRDLLWKILVNVIFGNPYKNYKHSTGFKVRHREFF